MLDFANQHIEPLETALRAALPDNLGIALVPSVADPSDLSVEEARAVARAIPSRKQEFAAGRRAARQAAEALNLAYLDLPMAADRAPVWPKGMVGSISHTRDTAGALVSHADSYVSLGFDLEDRQTLVDALLDTILNKQERRWLDDLPGDRRDDAALAIFSAKESAFKCQYPITGAMLGFDAVTITFDRGISRFSAAFNPEIALGLPGNGLDGLAVVFGGKVMTAAFLPKAQSG